MIRSVNASAPRRRVLIVDDDAELRRMCDVAFSLAGFEPVEAQNGYQGLAKAMETRPSVAVVDLWLPELDGLALIQRLRAHPETRMIPVLAITGHHIAGLRDRVEQAGADALLLKPLTPDDLTTTARLLMTRAALLREAAERRHEGDRRHLPRARR